MIRFILLLVTLITASQAMAAGGYLFVTFKGEKTSMTEQIYFALSSDGRQWNALNKGEPVLISQLGEKGVRDPYLLRAHDGKTFYLLATDLSINLHPGWKRASDHGSKSIVIWDTQDLVHWSEPRLVQIAADDAGCTWAPEAVYDEQTQDYLVFWASKTKSDNFAKQRIWAARTKDFITFDKAAVYIDMPHDVIDTDIVRESSTYYRFSKNEKRSAIFMEASDGLMGPWHEVQNFTLAGTKGYEGPECYPLAPGVDGKPGTWCLIIDHFAKGAGYEPFVTDDLASGQFKPGSGFQFPFLFRHGSILPVTAEEMERLQSAYGEKK